MNKLGPWLVALSVAIATPALAQRTPIAGATAGTNVKALQEISTAAAKDYQANRSKAIELAKKRGWVIEKTYKNGTHISLQGLDSKGLPIYYITYYNSRAAATTKTDQLWAGGTLGLTLSGASNAVNDKLAVWDGGRVRDTHQELRNRVIQKDKPDQSFNAHATHVSGTLMASGVNPYAKGMAHGLKTLQAYDFNSDRSEMAAAAATGILVSNHSYGTIAGWRFNSDRAGTSTDPYWEWWGDSEISSDEDYKFGYYDAAAAEWDRIAYSAPYYLIVKSSGNNRNEKGPDVNQPFHRRNRSGSFTLENQRPASISSNSGFDIISTYGNAKNILTVGAVNPIAGGYNQPSDVSISTFSSYGPTDDGRIKPDIVGNGVSVLSSTSESDQTYSSYNGTSMSSPNVAGSLLLLQEHYSNLKSGAVMRSATLKGLAIHTADEAGAAPGPDYTYGWGLMNASRAAGLITQALATGSNKKSMIEERTLSQGQNYQTSVIASGASPLVLTISWTDPEATALPVTKDVLNNRTPRLVNDLDIRVSDGNNSFLPWTLNPANPAESAKPGDNVLDNIEQILVPNAVPGKTYTITISHKGTTLKNNKQDYSLIVSGIGGAAYCESKATSESGANIKKVTIGTQSMTFQADACTTYKNFSDSVIHFEPGQMKSLAIEAGACGATSGKVAKAFIDWNRDGDFTDTGEEVQLTGTDSYAATITAPATAVAGETVLMRIVLQETSSAASVLACGTYERGETQDHYIEIVKQQKDIGVVSVKPLGSSLCANPAQKLVVKLQNFGATAQSNFPVSVIVRKNGNQLTELRSTYKLNLAPFATDEFLLDGSFATEAGASYEFVAQSALPGDAIAVNNTASNVLQVAAPSTAPEATAFRCGTNSDFSLTSSAGSNTFWYTSPTSTVPVAAGNIVLPATRVGSNLYAASSDFSATIGPATKSFATGGGYNQFDPDVLISTRAPVVLESARLYIGHSGKITFTVYSTNGVPVSSRTLNVVATRTPVAGEKPDETARPDDPADQGAIYYLGLEIPAAGEYNIAVEFEDGATIYRNNAGVTGYPFGVRDVFTISGNTATTNSSDYYYYFYGLKVSALGCKSERVAVSMVNGTPIEQPVVKINGHSLESNEATGNNWYLNGVEIAGAKGKSFTPGVSGSYSVKVIKDGCISAMSEPIDFVYDPEVDHASDDLSVYPNPSDGVFTLWLETQVKEDISFEVYDLMGKLHFKDLVKQKHGHFKSTIDFKPHASGVYILRVQHGDKLYVRKLVVQK